MTDPLPVETAPWARRDVLFVLLCMVTGSVASVLPHLVARIHDGSWEYLADGDEVLYLAVDRGPYHGERALRDPWARPEEKVATLYSWLQYVPLAAATHALGIPLIYQGLVWRFLGGLFLGLSLYVLFRVLFSQIPHAAGWAVCCALVVLGDCGMLERSLIGNAKLGLEAFHGQARIVGDSAGGQYRVVTPLTDLPVLLLLFALIANRSFRNLAALLLGCVLLALCVYLYFFFWTGAVAALCLYVLGNLLRPPRGSSRGAGWKEAGFVGAVIVGGLLLGAPQIIENQQVFSNPSMRPILDRLCRGCRIPPGDPVRTMYLHNTWAWGAILFGLAAWLLTRRPEVLLLAAATLAGFALQNSALISGLEFENYHWNYVHAPFREILFLTVGVLLLCSLRLSSTGRKAALAGVVLLFLGSGLFLRGYQSLRGTEPVYYRSVLRELRDLRPALAALDREQVLAGPFETNVAFLFGQAGQLFQFNYTVHTSLISDQEVHERHALNAWLQGISEEAYRAQARVEHFQAGVATRPEWSPDFVQAQRLAIFRRLEAGDTRLLDRYRPTHLLRRSGDTTALRGGSWRLAAEGQQWSLWRRRVEQAAGPGSPYQSFGGQRLGQAAPQVAVRHPAD